jgi:AcrR family transcriptional regulator
MTTGLRERKRLAVERALRLSAFTLMAENDADEVTVEQIAAAADVSTRTFFNYFATKDEVFSAPSVGEAEEFIERVLSVPPELSPLEALGQVIGEDLLRLEQEDTDWTLWLRVVQRNPAMLPTLLLRLGETEQKYAAAVAARVGAKPEELYPRVVAGCAMTVVRLAVSQVVEGGGRESVLEKLEAALGLVSAGLVPPC